MNREYVFARGAAGTGSQACRPCGTVRALDHGAARSVRRAFSGIVTGNVKEAGIQAIESLGPYELSGDPSIMRALDELLAAFVAQQRMRLPGSVYRPVYRLVA